jgi:hypothetical protein
VPVSIARILLRGRANAQSYQDEQRLAVGVELDGWRDGKAGARDLPLLHVSVRQRGEGRFQFLVKGAVPGSQRIDPLRGFGTIGGRRHIMRQFRALMGCMIIGHLVPSHIHDRCPA